MRFEISARFQRLAAHNEALCGATIEADAAHCTEQNIHIPHMQLSERKAQCIGAVGKAAFMMDAE